MLREPQPNGFVKRLPDAAEHIPDITPDLFTEGVIILGVYATFEQ